jgi:uncharacterized DUF497 family protein
VAVAILAARMLEFEWDPEKDRSNQEKHGVSFAEASSVFGDLSPEPFLIRGSSKGSTVS